MQSHCVKSSESPELPKCYSLILRCQSLSLLLLWWRDSTVRFVHVWAYATLCLYMCWSFDPGSPWGQRLRQRHVGDKIDVYSTLKCRQKLNVEGMGQRGRSVGWEVLLCVYACICACFCTWDLQRLKRIYACEGQHFQKQDIFIAIYKRWTQVKGHFGKYAYSLTD